MSKNAKTVQEELELRRENKQDIHECIREQSGQPADIHEWIECKLINTIFSLLRDILFCVIN
ncbi:MAG: hypothetical protein ACR2MG_16260 [Pyrinomonadaceae bacterium]